MSDWHPAFAFIAACALAVPSIGTAEMRAWKAENRDGASYPIAFYEAGRIVWRDCGGGR